MRNVQGKVPKSAQGMVTASVRTDCLQPDRESAQAQLQRMAETLAPKFPQVADIRYDSTNGVEVDYIDEVTY